MWKVLIASANSAGEQWAAWVAGVSLDAALLLALIGLAWIAIRGRVAPQVGYGLFLLVPLKLLVPLAVTVPPPLAQWTPSAWMASWFPGAHVIARVDRAIPVERRTATDRMNPPAPSARLSRSEPVAADAPQRKSTIELRPSREIASTAGSLAHPVAEAPRLSVRALLMIAWLVGVLLLLGRLVRAQVCFRVRLQNELPASMKSRLALDLREELRRRAVFPATIPIVECHGVAAPSVWGIARPTIILPQGLASSLTATQLEWVLLHEMAHIRRRDLAVLTLQRIAAILHFFNPTIWIANRILHQLREYACDDLAVSLTRASAVECGESFVQVLRYAERSRRGLDGALGIFGLDSRAPTCALRVSLTCWIPTG